VAELDGPAEHAVVHRQACGGSMREAYEARAPGRPEEHAEHAEGHGQGELRGLAQRAASGSRQGFADRHKVAELLDGHGERLVVHVDAAHQRHQHVAQPRLVAHEQRERTEVREAARFRHAQAERGLAAARGRQLEQAAHRGGRDLQVGLAEAAGRQADLGQQRPSVEAAGCGDVGEVREAGAADEG
jgi:hypothetical protein